MENVKIFLENGQETNVNAFFYIYNSKYYFMYTTGELDDPEYIKIYVAQVCKEVKNTPTGPVDTGYMLGMQISDPEEWTKVQHSITKIVSDKKGETQSSDIQYLPMSMLTNLKIVSKNKFKLMKNIVEENFKVVLSQSEVSNNPQSVEMQPTLVEPIQPFTPSAIETTPVTIEESVQPSISTTENTGINQGSMIEQRNDDDDVIVDYRTRFFEEQDKNKQLEEQIKELNEKLESIKNIIG